MEPSGKFASNRKLYSPGFASTSTPPKAYQVVPPAGDTKIKSWPCHLPVTAVTVLPNSTLKTHGEPLIILAGVQDTAGKSSPATACNAMENMAAATISLQTEPIGCLARAIKNTTP